MSNNTALISPTSFVQTMEYHWTTRLQNVASQPLRDAWGQLAQTFGHHILSHDDPSTGTNWTVLQPPTGSGKSQGTAVYCSMLERYEAGQHPGVIIVTKLKADADQMAALINQIAGRDDDYAFSYHADKAGPGVLDSLWTYPVLVITHRAYELALDYLGQEASIRQTWPYFHSWGSTDRKLIIIDEALDIVEESRGELEGLRLTLAAIPQKVREKFTQEIRAIGETIALLEQLAEGKHADGHETILQSMLDTGPEVNMTALRAEMRHLRFDLQLGRSDLAINRSAAQIHDDRLRSLQNIYKSWIYYAKVPVHGHTINTARLLIPDSVKGATVLDATASANVIYDLFDKAEVIRPPAGVRSYSNVTLHVSRGHNVGKVQLRSREDCLAERLMDTLNDQLSGRDVFLVTHKDVEARIQARPTTFAMKTGHWGAVVGSNEWKDCDAAVIFGLPYRPDTWTANAFFALQGVRDTNWLRTKDRPFGNHADIRSAMKTGQIVTDVVQAINRIRCRKVIDAEGNCPTADVYILLPNGSVGDDIVNGITDLMEGIQVKPWTLKGSLDKTKRAGRQSGSGNVQLAVMTYLRNMLPGTVSLTALRLELGIAERSLRRFIAETKDMTTTVAAAVMSLGVSFKVEGMGRGARSYFIKH